jgi:hypothetical protein
LNGGGGGSRTHAPILTKWPILTEITNNYEYLKKAPLSAYCHYKSSKIIIDHCKDPQKHPQFDERREIDFSCR